MTVTRRRKGAHMKNKKLIYTLMLPISICIALSASAGGLFGDMVNIIAPGVGTSLDDANRKLKDVLPLYKQVEEGGSHLVNETLVQAAAPALQEAIARSRDDALNNGVKPIPPDIRKNLTGFIPDAILDLVVYRVQGGGDLSLQVNAIRYGDVAAITLDYVIVFAYGNDAQYNAALWAHELTHVEQYQRWGIHDFAVKYVRNSNAVEKEAYDAQPRYVAWMALQRQQQVSPSGLPAQASDFNRPLFRLPINDASSLCGTMVTACKVGGSAPVGTPCWCNTPQGAAIGSLIPDRADGEVSRKRQVPGTGPESLPAPPPPPPPANACTTSVGSCLLSVGLGVGSSCTCMSPGGNFPGVAQQKPVNNVCSTMAGACPLGAPLFSGDSCYCPTYSGPVWGQVP